MPLAAAGMDGITGFVYLSDRGWSPEGLIFFGTELLLCGASAYFYRIAFTPWTEKREEEGLTPRQTVSLLILAGTLLLTLSKITLLGDLSVGRCAAAAAVVATAYKGGIGVGATVGVACGLGMDLAAGGMPFYSMAFALSGVMCGVFHRQGRLAAALAYVLSNALAVLWTWSEGLHLSLLYEVFIASVVFLVLPERALRQVGALVAREPRHDTQERARAYVRARMEATAAAFKSLYESMRSAFHPAAPNDNDAASVFDRRPADLQALPPANRLLQRDYVSTFNALNDALPAMLERGPGGERRLPRLLLQPLHEVPGVSLRRQRGAGRPAVPAAVPEPPQREPLGGVPPICRAGRGAEHGGCRAGGGAGTRPGAGKAPAAIPDRPGH